MRAARLLTRYNPNQQRVPTGNPRGGQWTSGGDRNRLSDDRPQPAGGSGAQLAGGFQKEDLALTVQQFVSANCAAKIQSRLPGQFLGSTIADVMRAGKSGDAAARSCLKLLGREEYRK